MEIETFENTVVHELVSAVTPLLSDQRSNVIVLFCRFTHTTCVDPRLILQTVSNMHVPRQVFTVALISFIVGGF